MKFEYTKWRKTMTLGVLTFWILLVGWSFIAGEGISSLVRLNLFFLGAFFGWLFYLQFFKGYVSVENGIIRLHSLPVKKIQIDEIVSANYIAGDYVFKSSAKQLNVTKTEIAKEQREEFELFYREIKSNLKT